MRGANRSLLPSAAACERRDAIARRLKTFCPTLMRTVAGVGRAHILNISQTGAKLHAQHAPDVGQTIEIAIGERRLGGSVRWKRGNTFGIAFDEPASDDILQDCLTGGAGEQLKT